PGTPTTYTIVVSNAGPSAVTGASVSDPLPAGASGGSWAFASPTGGRAVTAPTGGTRPLAATVAPLLNASLTLTFTVHHQPPHATVPTPPRLTPPAGTPDPDPANNRASDTVSLTPEAALSNTLSLHELFRSPGTPTTYTIVVSNPGPSAVTGASVSDPLPAGV